MQSTHAHTSTAGCPGFAGINWGNPGCQGVNNAWPTTLCWRWEFFHHGSGHWYKHQIIDVGVQVFWATNISINKKWGCSWNMRVATCVSDWKIFYYILLYSVDQRNSWTGKPQIHHCKGCSKRLSWHRIWLKEGWISPKARTGIWMTWCCPFPTSCSFLTHPFPKGHHHHHHHHYHVHMF